MNKFTPKWIICTQSSDSYKYTCKAFHSDKNGNPINNTYRFNKGVPYLVKNQEDYDEMIALSIFEDYVRPEERPVPQKSETPREKKLREKEELKAARKAETEAKNIPDGMTKEEAGQSNDTYLEPANVEDNSEIKEEED